MMVIKRRKIENVRTKFEEVDYYKRKKKKNLPQMKRYLKELEGMKGKKSTSKSVLRRILGKRNNYQNILEITPQLSKRLKEAVKENKGNVFVWVHPFFEVGIPGKLRKNKKEKIAENLRDFFKEQRKTKSNKPLIIFVEKENAEGTKNFIENLGYKGPVLFFDTEKGSTIAYIEKEGEPEKRKKIFQDSMKEGAKRELKSGKMVELLLDVGVKKMEMFGEFAGAGAACVDLAQQMVRVQGNKKIKTIVRKDLSYYVDSWDRRIYERRIKIRKEREDAINEKRLVH